MTKTPQASSAAHASAARAATLDATDRCDRCGAQAYVIAAFEASTLLFCAHHARTHADRLAGRIVLDQSHLLNEGNRQQREVY